MTTSAAKRRTTHWPALTMRTKRPRALIIRACSSTASGGRTSPLEGRQMRVFLGHRKVRHPSGGLIFRANEDRSLGSLEARSRGARDLTKQQREGRTTKHQSLVWPHGFRTRPREPIPTRGTTVSFGLFAVRSILAIRVRSLINRALRTGRAARQHHKRPGAGPRTRDHDVTDNAVFGQDDAEKSFGRNAGRRSAVEHQEWPGKNTNTQRISHCCSAAAGPSVANQ